MTSSSSSSSFSILFRSSFSMIRTLFSFLYFLIHVIYLRPCQVYGRRFTHCIRKQCTFIFTFVVHFVQRCYVMYIWTKTPMYFQEIPQPSSSSSLSSSSSSSSSSLSSSSLMLTVSSRQQSLLPFPCHEVEVMDGCSVRVYTCQPSHHPPVACIVLAPPPPSSASSAAFIEKLVPLFVALEYHVMVVELPEDSHQKIPRRFPSCFPPPPIVQVQLLRGLLAHPDAWLPSLPTTRVLVTFHTTSLYPVLCSPTPPPGFTHWCICAPPALLCDPYDLVALYHLHTWQQCMHLCLINTAFSTRLWHGLCPTASRVNVNGTCNSHPSRWVEAIHGWLIGTGVH